MFVGELLWVFAKAIGIKIKYKVGECPYVQPGSQMTQIRQLLGIMKTDHSWNYSLSNDFSSTGGFKAAMKNLFQIREKEWPGVSFKDCFTLLALVSHWVSGVWNRIQATGY